MTDLAAEPLLADPPPLHCYRHPDRETYVRCGRCDQPICTKCAMQGPVGFRCKSCGKPARDALSSLRPSQVAIALALSVGGGLLIGFLAGQLGWFMILIAFFGGGLIADAVDRAIGIKRSSWMRLIVLGGILLGGLAGTGFGTWTAWNDLTSLIAGEEGVEAPSFLSYFLSIAAWNLLAVGAAMAAAYGRMRL
jgi:hypothetical protein